MFFSLDTAHHQKWKRSLLLKNRLVGSLCDIRTNIRYRVLFRGSGSIFLRIMWRAGIWHAPDLSAFTHSGPQYTHGQGTSLAQPVWGTTLARSCSKRKSCISVSPSIIKELFSKKWKGGHLDHPDCVSYYQTSIKHLLKDPVQVHIIEYLFGN